MLSGSEGVAYVAHIGGFLGGLGLAILMLKKKWIVMERDEKSILEMLWRKRKEIPGIPKEELEYWRKELKKSGRKKSKTITSSLRPEKTESEFIHFSCSCGQRIQVSREHAGKTGQCPKCSERFRVPETHGK